MTVPPAAKRQRRPRAQRPPSPPSPRDLAALERIGALLAQPAAFRAWLEALPADSVLAPAGVQDRWYWADPLENPIGQWLRAEGARAVWFYRKRTGQYRLLVSHTWQDAPGWVARLLAAFWKRCAELERCLDAAYPRSPTPTHVLPLLARAMAEAPPGEGGRS